MHSFKVRLFKNVAFVAAVATMSLAGASAAIAPDFSLPSRSGGTVALSQLKGQVVMINFWASWCGPCKQEMPLLEQIYKKYNPAGFTLLGVNVDDKETRKDVEAWLTKAPVSFPVLLDTEKKVRALYGSYGEGMPMTVFVDRQGNVRNVHRGYTPGDEGEYLNQIRALIRE